MEEVIVNKKSKKIPILLSILVFLIVLTSGTYYYWYMHQIIKVNDIKLIVKQSEKLELPKNISVNLRNNSTRKIDVKWDSKKIDADIASNINLKGTVQGYDKKINIEVSIKPYISSAPEISKVIIQGDNYYSKLPESVEVTSSASWLDHATIKWADNIDVNKVGKFVVLGKIAENKEMYFVNKNVQAKYNFEVISRDDAIDRLTSKNQFLKKSETIAAINQAKALPINVLRKLVDDNVNITFVDSIPVQGNMRIEGTFNSENFNINVVYTNSKEYLSNVTIVLLHEIGHSFDFNKSKGVFTLSNAYAFQNIKNTEETKLFNGNLTYDEVFISHTLSAPEEYFAECFALYFYNDKTKEMLKEKAPLTYEYIKKIFSEN